MKKFLVLIVALSAFLTLKLNAQTYAELLADCYDNDQSLQCPFNWSSMMEETVYLTGFPDPGCGVTITYQIRECTAFDDNCPNDVKNIIQIIPISVRWNDSPTGCTSLSTYVYGSQWPNNFGNADPHRVAEIMLSAIKKLSDKIFEDYYNNATPSEKTVLECGVSNGNCHFPSGCQYEVQYAVPYCTAFCHRKVELPPGSGNYNYVHTWKPCVSNEMAECCAVKRQYCFCKSTGQIRVNTITEPGTVQDCQTSINPWYGICDGSGTGGEDAFTSGCVTVCGE